jgi:hypothetical protein
LVELNSAKDVMTHVLKLGETVQMKLVILLWLWCSEQNVVWEGDRRRTTGELAYVVHKNAVEFLEVHKQPIGGQMRSVQCWSKPPKDWLEINSDGAFLLNEGKGGWRYVITEARDVIIAGAGHQKHARDALQMEVYACSKGVQATVAKGMTRVILETDSLILKQALESDSYRFA